MYIMFNSSDVIRFRFVDILHGETCMRGWIEIISINHSLSDSLDFPRMGDQWREDIQEWLVCISKVGRCKCLIDISNLSI